MACPCELKPLAIYQKVFVENMTVVRPPMLKMYYWESFDIAGLNKKLKSNKLELQHTIVVPSRPINSQPLKTIIWLRNLSDRNLDVHIKRVKKCDCKPKETRIGFNQYRQLYHCPHRRLVYIGQELLSFKPGELLPLSITNNFFLYGDHHLTYELNFSDKRKLMLHFVIVISAFDPEKALLTKELIPVNIRKFERVTQPIWVRNTTMMNLPFSFSSRDRNLKLLNTNLQVPRQSVWPLMVEYRPNDYENEIELQLSYENLRSKHIIAARGVTKVEPEDSDMPLKEKDCADFIYVIYPNRLHFDACLREERTQIVNVHNYGQKCMEFHWQNYIINDFFSVNFEPQVFRLKAHHSKLCVIKVTVYDHILHFRRVPLVLEVHRILDRATQIAKAELEEIESIDDPKWKEDSYAEHVFLHLNIQADRANFFDEQDDDICDEKVLSYDFDPQGAAGDNEAAESLPPVVKTPEELRAEIVKRLGNKPKLTANEIIELSMAIDQRITIFEKLYWKYLSKSDFMRIKEDRSKRFQLKTYQQIVEPVHEQVEDETCTVDRKSIMEILSHLMVEAITDLSKNWVFIPAQYYERIA